MDASKQAYVSNPEKFKEASKQAYVNNPEKNSKTPQNKLMLTTLEGIKTKNAKRLKKSFKQNYGLNQTKRCKARRDWYVLQQTTDDMIRSFVDHLFTKIMSNPKLNFVWL